MVLSDPAITLLPRQPQQYPLVHDWDWCCSMIKPLHIHGLLGELCSSHLPSFSPVPYSSRLMRLPDTRGVQCGITAVVHTVGLLSYAGVPTLTCPVVVLCHTVAS